jgi:hypothetical protein
MPRHLTKLVNEFIINLVKSSFKSPMIHMDYDEYQQIKELDQQITSGIRNQAVNLYLLESGRLKEEEAPETATRLKGAVAGLSRTVSTLSNLWGPQNTNQLVLEAERRVMSGDGGILPPPQRTHTWPNWIREAKDPDLGWSQITRNPNLCVPYLHLEGEAEARPVITETQPKTPVIMAWEVSQGAPEITQPPKEEVIVNPSLTPATTDQVPETVRAIIMKDEHAEEEEDQRKGEDLTPRESARTASDGTPLPQWLENLMD